MAGGGKPLGAAGTQAVAGTQGGGAAGGVTAAGARSALNFTGLDFEGAFAASGIQPGQQPTPLRIGRDQHPLWAAAAAGRPAGERAGMCVY